MPFGGIKVKKNPMGYLRGMRRTFYRLPPWEIPRLARAKSAIFFLAKSDCRENDLCTKGGVEKDEK